jgi:hypothetical protein
VLERRLTGAIDELQHRIVQWLSVPDPSSNYHTALKKRHPKTGRWLVDGRQFDDWKRSDASLMWLHGNGEFAYYYDMNSSTDTRC